MILHTRSQSADEADAVPSVPPAAVPTTALATLPTVRLATTTTKPHQSHRRHKRTRADELLVKVRVGDGSVVARVEDISVGGLFARTQKSIPVGAFVELSLIRPGYEELPLTGVIVDDTAKRAGLAVRFENVDGHASAALRRAVFDAQVKAAGDDPDVDVAPTRAMTPASAELTSRDREMEELRRKVALLTAKNERLRSYVEQADAAHKLAGRLQLELDRLKGSVDGGVAIDAALLSDIKRDAEQAWTAIARVTDAIDKLK